MWAREGAPQTHALCGPSLTSDYANEGAGSASPIEAPGRGGFFRIRADPTAGGGPPFYGPTPTPPVLRCPLRGRPGNLPRFAIRPSKRAVTANNFVLFSRTEKGRKRWFEDRVERTHRRPGCAPARAASWARRRRCA